MGSGGVGRVVLDGMGVLYEQRGIAALLADFAAGRGVAVDPVRARELYRSASRGELTSAALWDALGIRGPDPDAEFLGRRTLMPGAGAFLERMRRAGIPVGCITNDVAEWSLVRRRSLGLEGEIEPWVVSGEVGVRKPAREIYEHFLAAAACAPGDCLFVDDTVENLHAAAALGFRTVWFRAGPAAPSGDRRGDHLRLASFEEVSDLTTELHDRLSRQGG